MNITKIHLAVESFIDKIFKFLSIKFCYDCGTCIWWSSRTGHFSEEPNDVLGFRAPVCKKHLSLNIGEDL